MDNVKFMALLVSAEAVNHGRENILPALEIPLAAVSLNRCINEVTNMAKRDALDGAATGNELPHDWNKAAEAMRKAEKEIREAALPDAPEAEKCES